MIHYCLQNSEEWEALRRGKLTASEAGDWLLAESKLNLTGDQIKAKLDELGIAYKKSSTVGVLTSLLPAEVINDNQGYLKKDLEARQAAMYRMITRELGTVTSAWTGNRFTDFGNEFEDEAASEFELRTGFICEKVGFVTLDGYDYIGCSPDRYVYSADKSTFLGPLEIKCKPEGHAKMVIEDIMPDDHKLQLHFQMVMSGSNKGFFFGYSPDMQPLMKVVYADSYTSRLEESLIRFNEDYKAFRAVNLPKIQVGEIQNLGKEVA